MNPLGQDQCSNAGVNIAVSHGPIYVGSHNPTCNTTVYFTNTESVSIPITAMQRQVFVSRNGSYTPMLTAPNLVNNSSLTYFFNKPETGFII